MEVTAEQEHVQLLANQMFDAYAESKRNHSNDLETKYRAVAAAYILSRSEGEEKWFRVLDANMSERGIATHYSDVSAKVRRKVIRLSFQQLGEPIRATLSEDVELLELFTR